jgi:hypothetical protein
LLESRILLLRLERLWVEDLGASPQMLFSLFRPAANF